MEPTLSAEQVESVVLNLHHDPFQILGPHEIEVNGNKSWVVRAFVPDSTEVYLLDPATSKKCWLCTGRMGYSSPVAGSNR